MDNKLKDLKYFLLYHYEQGRSKKTLLKLLYELEDEKREILQVHYKIKVEDTKPREQKKYLMLYIKDITLKIDKARAKDKMAA